MLDAQISSETILPQDGFSVDFEHIVYIFWKYITCAMDWYIVWLYLRTLIFHPCGGPQRELFCSRGPMHSCALIVSLTFFIVLVWGTSEPNFLLLSQFARLLWWWDGIRRNEMIWWSWDGKLLKHCFYTWGENYLRNRKMGRT